MAELSGPLVIIGGHEDKDGPRVILNEVARHLRGGKLVIATLASHEPEGYFDSYRQAFAAIGATDLVELYIEARSDSLDGTALKILQDAAGVLFTGGDQRRIMNQIGGTPVERRIADLHRSGSVIAGTSAGAAVMAETMLVEGAGEKSHRIGDLRMAPGLGLVRDVVVDQHFAERGRHGRLLGAVASNPRFLGIGIDEDTAIVVKDGGFTVIGRSAAFIVDAETVTQSNIDQAHADRALSMFDIRTHLLSSGDGFDLGERRPTPELTQARPATSAA